MGQNAHWIKQIPRIDISLLLGIPVTLAALHFLIPDVVYSDLWFYYSDPNVLSAWTAAYTHGSNQHLLNNVASYGLTISVAYYLLAILMNARNVFWMATTVLLLVTPFITTAFDYGVLYEYYELFPSDADSKGFSGIVGGFAGMTLGGIGVYVSRQHGIWTGLHSVVGVFLAAASLLSIVHGTFSPRTGLLLIIGFSALGATYISLEDVKSRARVTETIQANAEVIVVVVGFGMIVCVLAYSLVPVEVVQSDSFVNVYSHATGFLFGTIVTGIVALLQSNTAELH